MRKICIVDYGLNNLSSVKNACLKFDIDAKIIENYNDIANSDVVILPGVGSFPEAIRNLKEKNFFEPILEFINNKNKIFIGICLGMQMLFESSNEFGFQEGFKFFNGKIKRFSTFNTKKIPHIGWRNINIKKTSKLTKNFNIDDNFYFVHSYFAEITKTNSEFVLSTSNYYDENFISSIEKDNVYGFQFHPEKSGVSGMKFYKNLYKIISNV